MIINLDLPLVGIKGLCSAPMGESRRSLTGPGGRAGSGRVRPSGRRDDILAVATEVFGREGLHGASLARIAAEVGVSAPALYRHFPNKYALFAHACLESARTVLSTAEQGARAGATAGRTGDPRAELEGIVTALTRLAVRHRSGGRLFGIQARHLEPEDRARFTDLVGRVRATVAGPLERWRGPLPPVDRDLLVGAGLSAVLSVAVHRPLLADDEVVAVLPPVALAVLATVLPPPATDGGTGEPRRFGPLTRREALVDAALREFTARGYPETTVEDVAGAVGMAAPTVYRQFAAKTDLLEAALQRGLHQVVAVSEAAVADAPDAVSELRALTHAYAGLWLRQPDLMTVYLTETHRLAPPARRELRAAQRAYLQRWAQLLVEAGGPGTTEEAAAYRVRAAVTLVADLRRRTRHDHQPASAERLEALMWSALGVGRA